MLAFRPDIQPRRMNIPISLATERCYSNIAEHWFIFTYFLNLKNYTHATLQFDSLLRSNNSDPLAPTKHMANTCRSSLLRATVSTARLQYIKSVSPRMLWYVNNATRSRCVIELNTNSDQEKAVTAATAQSSVQRTFVSLIVKQSMSLTVITDCTRPLTLASRSECDPGWGTEWATASACPLNVCCSEFGMSTHS
jgi:hypothetical protein